MKRRITGILASLALLLAGCTEKSPETAEPMDFTVITITESGSMASTWEIEAVRTEHGAEISLYNGGWEYDDELEREDCLVQHRAGGEALYGEIVTLAGRCGVSAWDGFSESDPNVMDGTMIRFYAQLPDGRQITANGTNAFPAHYRDLRSGLLEIVNEEQEAGS